MTILHSLVLGIVEGFTEFLPISSTAHLVLASHILGLDQSVFQKTFEISIQSGAILAVIAIYWKRFLDWEVLKKIAVAFIPTGVIGLILYKLIKVYLIGNISIILWTLAIGGIILIFFDFAMNRTAASRGAKTPNDPNQLKGDSEKDGQAIKELSYMKTALIGVVQAIAVIPGVSRSAATIIGGRILGLSKEAVVEFSFLLAVPTILAATGLDLVQNISAFSRDQAGLLIVGLVASFVTAIFGIKFLLKFIRTKSFAWFGFYRIVVAVVFLIFVL